MTALYERIVRATVAANRRADEAEARAARLENLVAAVTRERDRWKGEADALYLMLPDQLRPTT